MGKTSLSGRVAQKEDEESTSVLVSQVITTQGGCDVAERAILTMMLHKTKKNEISFNAFLFQLR